MSVESLGQSRPRITIKQKSRRFEITSMTPEEINLISSSPTLEERGQLSDTSKYQRKLNHSRFGAIRKFWDDAENQLVDNVVIVVKDQQFPGCIDLSTPNWMKFEFDGQKIADILDGQHRVMGCVKSEAFLDEPIPVSILLESEFPPKALGLLFTKLNSEAKPIDSTMEMHLKARYRLKPWADIKAQNSYQAMLALYDDTTTPLFGKIQLFDESGKRYTSRKIAKTFQDLWNNTAFGSRMPHPENKPDFMIQQFSYFLKSLFGSGGIWEERFGEEYSSLYKSDGFCDLCINLYPDFFQIVEEYTGSGTPTLLDWQNAMGKINDGTKHLTDVLQWGDYQNYINERTHSRVFCVIEKLLKYEYDSGGELVFEFESKLKGFSTVLEYLQSYIGDFDLVFYSLDENGEYVETENPESLDFKFEIQRAELAKDACRLTVHQFDESNNSWIPIKKDGSYSTNKRHLYSQNLKGSLKNEFVIGGRYKFTITQSTSGNQMKQKEFKFEFPN